MTQTVLPIHRACKADLDARRPLDACPPCLGAHVRRVLEGAPRIAASKLWALASTMNDEELGRLTRDVANVAKDTPAVSRVLVVIDLLNRAARRVRERRPFTLSDVAFMRVYLKNLGLGV